MKKILTGLAVSALAVAATGAGSASAGAGTSVYDQMTAGRSTAKTLIDASGLASQLDDCGNTGNNNGLPDYTVFFPSSDAIFGAVLDALDLTLGELAAQPALVKTVLLYHVHGGNISPTQLADNSNTSFSTLGGLTLTKTTQLDKFYGYIPFNFDDYYNAQIGVLLQLLYVYIVNELGGPSSPAGFVFTQTYTAAQFIGLVKAAYLSKYPGLPTELSFYINGYKVSNAKVTLGYETDFNTWFAKGIDESEFLDEAYIEIDDLVDRIDWGLATWDEALPILVGNLVALLDVEDDVHTTIMKDVTPGPLAEACNGWVYYINGILSTSTAAGSQGTTTSGQGQAAAGGTTGEIPATGAESLALTYAALASLIAGAGLLVIRRRSVA